MVRCLVCSLRCVILIFVAEPELPGTQSAWVALNTNMAIDVHQCALYALPGA